MGLNIASCVLGLVIGFVCGAILAVALREQARKNPKEAIKSLQRIGYWAALGGGGDYVVFDLILSSGGFVYYICGFAVTFFLIAIGVVIDYLRG